MGSYRFLYDSIILQKSSGLRALKMVVGLGEALRLSFKGLVKGCGMGMQEGSFGFQNVGLTYSVLMDLGSFGFQNGLWVLGFRLSPGSFRFANIGFKFRSYGFGSRGSFCVSAVGYGVVGRAVGLII